VGTNNTGISNAGIGNAANYTVGTGNTVSNSTSIATPNDSSIEYASIVEFASSFDPP
jgi:hypothetical protein